MTGPAYLSRTETVRRLRQLQRAKGAPLIAAELVGADAWVRWSALHHFGTFTKARKAAGLARPRYRQKWTKDALLTELRKVERQGIRITPIDMERAGLGWLLVSLHKYVGGLTKARALASIAAPPRRTVSRSGLDEQSIVLELQRLKRSGDSLAYSLVEPRFRRAAASRFGSWRAAVEAAGFDYATVALRQHRFSDHDLLAILRDLHAQHPRMTLTQLQRQRHGNALLRRFGSFERAAKVAGIDGWPVRKHAPVLLSRRAVVTELRRRARAGLSCSYKGLREEAPELITAAVRHYRTLSAALQKAAHIA